MVKSLFPILLVLAFLAGTPGLRAQSDHTSAQRFTTHGLDKEGNLRWVLEGDSVNFRGNVMELKDDQARIIEIKNCQAVMHGSNGRLFSLMTPSCNVMMALRELKSNSVLQFKTDGFEGSSIGYDVNLEQRILRLRSTVHITIRSKSGLHKREKSPDKDSNNTQRN